MGAWGGQNVHYSKAEHARQRDALAERDLYVKKVFRGPKEDDEVGKGVLA